jgi:hypothetical protein
MFPRPRPGGHVPLGVVLCLPHLRGAYAGSAEDAARGGGHAESTKGVSYDRSAVECGGSVSAAVRGSGSDSSGGLIALRVRLANPHKRSVELPGQIYQQFQHCLHLAGLLR